MHSTSTRPVAVDITMENQFAQWQSQLRMESVKNGIAWMRGRVQFLKLWTVCKAGAGIWTSRVALRIVGDDNQASANQKGDRVSKLALIRNGSGEYKWIHTAIQG